MTKMISPKWASILTGKFCVRTLKKLDVLRFFPQDIVFGNKLWWRLGELNSRLISPEFYYDLLVCARLRHVTGTQWGNKKSMTMKHLEATAGLFRYRLTSFPQRLQTFLRIILDTI